MTDLPRSMSAAQLREYQRTGRLPEFHPTTSVAGQIADSPPKRHKYGVGPRHLRQVDGYTFDSVAERRRYEELRLMEKAGEIVDLRVHPEWSLDVEGEHICRYVADFTYRQVVDMSLGRNACGPRVVEDVKGGSATRTRLYETKRKLMRALHGIEITEIEVK